ncbi:hypothetical protein ACHAQA_008035 [Verticillium albo-atrum]
MPSRSTIPGPFWAAPTDLWMARFDLTGKRTAIIQTLHKRYGPAVRVGPKTFCFASARALRDIYNHKPRLDRPRGDALFLEQFGRENLVSTRCGALHFRRRRAVAGVYAAPAVGGDAVQGVLHSLVDRFMDNLESLRTGERGCVDVWSQLRWLAADVTARVSFGEASGLDLLGDKEGQRERMGFYLSSRLTEEEIVSVGGLLSAWFPRTSKALARVFPSWFIIMTDTQRWALDVTPKAMEAEIKEGNMVPVALQLARHMKENEQSEIVPDAEYIASEALDHWLAGSLTTPDALSWLVYELSRPENQHRQQRLRDELLAAGITADSRPNTHDLSTLSYLDCVLRETLRRHPPIPASLTREAPDGGMTIDGHFVPSRARVSVQANSLHMDPNVFAEPSDWNPERWELPRTSPCYKAMHKSFWPFGSGPRMCIGMQ